MSWSGKHPVTSILLSCVGLAGCAAASGSGSRGTTSAPAAAGPASRESPWLGVWPKGGCFHVKREGQRTYHFVLDDVEYLSQKAPGGQVGVIVRAVDIGDLATHPTTLPRNRRLEFWAEGTASGAFEVTLFLIDSQGNDYEPRTLTRICFP